MSKSLGNTILVSDPPEEIQDIVKSAVTDPQKIHLSDPGRPEICNVFTFTGNLILKRLLKLKEIVRVAR